MKRLSIIIAICAFSSLFMTSCETYHHTMREPNMYFELYANNLELSEQFTAEATVTRIVGVDWERLFGITKTGETDVTSVAAIPVIGDYIKSNGANLAMYELMAQNPGYDVVVYPQVEIHKVAPVLGTDIYSTTTYKVTARLGKIKK